MESFTQRQQFDYFHEQLITQFIPEGQRALLRIERYERGQAEGEPLGKYIQDIREAALVLRIAEPEIRVVNRILQGLTHAQRARFVFQTPPSTLVQLQ
jgi:hypothetical protein